jgi:hypothetical protein
MTNNILFARKYDYVIDAPGRVEHGTVVTFDGRTAPAMHGRERFQLSDGTMAWIQYRGPAQG